MLGRPHRFHGHNALRATYQRGQTVRAPQISLKFSFRDPRRPYRVAVVVSRKVSKSAVVRNRIRRRIYEIARTQGDALPPGTDLVFTAFNADLAVIGDQQLRATITGLLRKAVREHRRPVSGML